MIIIIIIIIIIIKYCKGNYNIGSPEIVLNPVMTHPLHFYTSMNTQKKKKESRCPDIKFKVSVMQTILILSLFGKKHLNTLVSELNFISEINI